VLEPANSKKDFKCDACGADVTYSAEYQSLKCEFCGKITQLIQDNQVVPTSCDFVIPLQLSDKTIDVCAYEYMSSGAYTPDDIIENSRILKVEKIYAPFFRFQGQYTGTWTASFGYDRQVSYTDWERDANGGSRPVTKTRTETDWSPVSGMLQGTFDLVGYAGSSLSNGVASFLEAEMSLENSTSEPVNYVAGLEVENISQPERHVFAERVDSRYEHIVREDALSNAQGDNQRDWNWKANCTYETSSLLAPVCHVVFEYEQTQYNVWIDGANASRSMGDTLPTDLSRETSVNLSFIPLIIAVIGTVLFFWLYGSGLADQIFWSFVVIGFAGLYGYVRRSSLLGHSEKARGAILAFQKASLSNNSDKSAEEQHQIAESFQKPARNLFSSQSNALTGAASASVIIALVGLFLSANAELKSSKNLALQTRVVSSPSLPSPSIEPRQQLAPSIPTQSSASQTKPIVDLCKDALNSNQSNWDSDQNYRDAVLEAQRRGLTVRSCQEAVNPATRNLPAPSTSNQNAAGVHQTKPIVDLCKDALNSNQSNWDSDQNYRDAVLEAQRRGLTVRSCQEAVNPATRNPNSGNASGNNVSRTILDGNTDCTRADDGRPVCRDAASGRLRFVTPDVLSRYQEAKRLADGDVGRQSQQSLGGSMYTVFPNSDLPGNDIYARPSFVSSFEECADQCLRNTECRAFTFNGRVNACFLKHTKGPRSPFLRAESGFVDRR